MAEDDASDADTFLADSAQRAMFEDNFTTGMLQDEEITLRACRDPVGRTTASTR